MRTSHVPCSWFHQCGVSGIRPASFVAIRGGLAVGLARGARGVLAQAFDEAGGVAGVVAG